MSLASSTNTSASSSTTSTTSNDSPNTITCRVQYLNDSQPFNTTNFPEPPVPLKYPFLVNVNLGAQIHSVHHLLNAPLQVHISPKHCF